MDTNPKSAKASGASYLKTITILLIPVLTASLFWNYTMAKQLNELKRHLPYLTVGEPIDYFDLLDSNGKEVNLSNIEGKHCLVYIFSEPMASCNKNIVLWDKIASLVGDKVSVFGIIPDDAAGMVEFAERLNLRFPLYVPKNLERFKKDFRLKINLPQTLFISNQRVERLKIGTVGANEYTALLKFIKQLLT